MILCVAKRKKLATAQSTILESQSQFSMSRNNPAIERHDRINMTTRTANKILSLICNHAIHLHHKLSIFVSGCPPKKKKKPTFLRQFIFQNTLA